MTHTPQEIIAKLGELSADEIARLLRDEGVTGRRSHGRSCPVANYVSATTGVSVTITSGWAAPGADARGELPDTVNAFVDLFDAGEFPELRATP